MKERMGIYRGVNLGGWLSQCDYSRERLMHFITEKDIGRIASWGLDHVRIPVDYNILQDEKGQPLEAGYERIDWALKTCRAHGLKIVLDLHKTAGFSFDKGENEAGFFDSEAYQNLFYALWEEIARRYGAEADWMAFELLNEVTEQRYMDAWNRISAECIRRVRVHAPRTFILVGSYYNNSVRTVSAMPAPVDERVIYNFHCYDPLFFTHQGAGWTDAINPSERWSYEESGATEAFFEDLFADAIRTARENHTTLYCGEYGVIDVVQPADTVKWYRAIHAVLERHGIGRSAWSYKQMDFGLSDKRLDGVRDELIQYL